MSESDVKNISSNGISSKKSSKCPAHIQFKSAREFPDKLESDFVYPNLPSKCTWDRTQLDQLSPHTHRPL